MLKKILYFSLILSIVFANPVYGQKAEGGSEETISLDFKGMDVVDVLKLLAQRGNMNIAISNNVRGKVTMFLKDVSVNDAFEIILVSNELAYEQAGNIINVMTGKDYENLYGQKFNDKRIIESFELKHAKAEEVSKALNQIKSKIGKVIVDEGTNSVVIMDSPALVAMAKNLVLTLDKPVETRVFSLDYAKAEEVKAKIEEKLTKNVGAVQVDERTNKIIIKDLSSKMAEMERLVAELDEQTREVLIEAKILEVTLNDEFKWGVNWDRIIKMASRAGDWAIGVNFADAITGAILPAETGSIIGASFEAGTITTQNMHVMMEILKTIGKTEVLSSPRIVVINNEEASILVGTNQPYATTGTTISETVSQTTQQVTYVDLGIKLHVTPSINKYGYITMKIKPEVSSKTGDYTITSEEGTTVRTTTVPIISTSEAETTVMVKDGYTIVLAGLIEKRSEQHEDKIPGLGDIPLLGYMFKSKTRGSSDNPERKELVIFLTPHIISGEQQSPEVKEYLTTTEVGKSEIVQPEKEKIRTKFSWGRHKEEPQKPVAPAVKDKAPDAVMRNSLSPTSPEAYYNLVRNRVLEIARCNYPRSGIKGDVCVSFAVASDGSLEGEPKILSSVDESLKMLAINSVKKAAPFPRFPESITEPVETFKIIISYK